MMDNVSNDILTFYMYVHINYIWYMVWHSTMEYGIIIIVLVASQGHIRAHVLWTESLD